MMERMHVGTMKLDSYGILVIIIIFCYSLILYHYTSQALINSCSDLMSNLVLVRSERLSNESTFLPPAHFLVARVLAAMIIIGYTIATVPIVDESGNPPLISSAFFSVLLTVYLFFSAITST